MIKRYFELENKILDYHKDANTQLLKKAYTVAAEAHMKQERATREPFITHPLSVASILADMKMDEITITAALLHDIVEDTETDIRQIKKMFGAEISNLVWGVTKISKLSSLDALDAKAQTLKKMIIAMSDDVRVILIKLADRVHNMSTLHALPPEKQKKIARETLDIYAPIAYRLGMARIKTTLENIAFKYAFPAEHRKIKESIFRKIGILREHIKRIKLKLQEILTAHDIPGDISFRIKRPISIYRKLERQKIQLEKVYDLLAFRIITDTTENCYTILGEIHQIWKHIPERLRDFISNPKSNGYQSLQTTVIDSKEIIFEIQIRTHEMHVLAEEGIAAHWKYKEGISFIQHDERLQWFREMIQDHVSNPDPHEFLNLVKGDLTPNEIYVFTPKGKIINLKAGSTPIDFAYAIHSEIGHKCARAIVNEHMVPIRTRLKSGDVVEIQTSRDVSPNIDWLKHVATHRARKAISAYISKRENSILIAKGKRIWNRIFQKYKKKSPQEATAIEFIDRIKKLNYKSKEPFFKDIGSGNIKLDSIFLRKLFPRIAPPKLRVKKRSRPPKGVRDYKLVRVEGYDDIDISLARCCNPIKGDSIKGYMTSNRGLVIHKSGCANLKGAIDSKIKQVKWNLEEDSHYLIKYDILADDRIGVLNKITAVLSEFESNIRDLKTSKISQKNIKITLTFEVKNTTQLKNIVQQLKLQKSVYTLIRKRFTEK